MLIFQRNVESDGVGKKTFVNSDDLVFYSTGIIYLSFINVIIFIFFVFTLYVVVRVRDSSRIARRCTSYYYALRVSSWVRRARSRGTRSLVKRFALLLLWLLLRSLLFISVDVVVVAVSSLDGRRRSIKPPAAVWTRTVINANYSLGVVVVVVVHLKASDESHRTPVSCTHGWFGTGGRSEQTVRGRRTGPRSVTRALITI